MIKMIKVYAQIGDAAIQVAVFRRFGERERQICQTLSNRFKSEVRAISLHNQMLGHFVPHREECSEGC